VLIGGLSASYYHEELVRLPFVDFVMRGDSTEEPVRQLIFELYYPAGAEFFGRIAPYTVSTCSSGSENGCDRSSRRSAVSRSRQPRLRTTVVRLPAVLPFARGSPSRVPARPLAADPLV
jgi:hypothetical protein